MIDEPRQPTMEELRAKIGSILQTNGRKPRYAGTPGKGPVGMTCHDCGWLTHTGQSNPSAYPKCGKTAFTSGDATTIRTRTPACEHFAADHQDIWAYRKTLTRK
jgi:hypothetical protein